MTTIAYRDGVLAADSLRTSNGMRDGFTRKVHRVGRLLVAAAGSAPRCAAFRSWVCGGLQGPSPFQDNDDGNGVVVPPDGVAIVWGKGGPWRLAEVPFFAIGSGEQVAMGAMLAGASAEEAVAAAIKLNTGSGGRIDAVCLHAS